MTATLKLAAAIAAESTLKYRAAMEGLVEPNIESADPKAHVEVAPVSHRDTFRVPDDEFDLIQDGAENDFFQENQEAMQHREGRSARQAW